MQSFHNTSPPLSEVTALFPSSTTSFSLSNSATFGDLADRLEVLGERHTGTPRAIYLKLAHPGSRQIAVLST